MWLFEENGTVILLYYKYGVGNGSEMVLEIRNMQEKQVWYGERTSRKLL